MKGSLCRDLKGLDNDWKTDVHPQWCYAKLPFCRLQFVIEKFEHNEPTNQNLLNVPKDVDPRS